MSAAGDALFTDFYELSMMYGYHRECPDRRAVFEVFFRSLPFDGGYAVFAGLAPLLEYLEGLRFTAEDLDYLTGLGSFDDSFMRYLAGFSFRGDVWSVAEGTPVFANEPVLRVSGSIMEAQLVESAVLNHVNFSTLVATKAARIVHAAGRAPVLEFGLRRAPGPDGAHTATRAAFIGGAAATSNTAAGRDLGVPVSGTMAHSWVMGFASEREAFERYVELYPDRPVLLVDTFDTLRSGVPNAIAVFSRLASTKPGLMAVRIDSGDLEYLSAQARILFDAAGLTAVKIYVSSDLDEYIIEHLRNRKAPIDAWGVGTRLVTGWGEPAMTGVYKMAAKSDGGADVPCIKISNQPEKITNPGVKNTVRFFGADGQMLADLVCLDEERVAVLELAARGEPLRFNHPSSELAHFEMRDYGRAGALLDNVMRNGKMLSGLPDLALVRERCAAGLSGLDETYRRLLNPHRYRVSISDRLKSLKVRMMEEHRS